MKNKIRINDYIRPKREPTVIVSAEISVKLKEEVGKILKSRGVTWVEFIGACCDMYIAENRGWRIDEIVKLNQRKAGKSR